MLSLTTVEPPVNVQFNYSRSSCLFAVLATVETFCICSVLTTKEPLVYFQSLLQ